jgi:hypothetical protein
MNSELNTLHVIQGIFTNVTAITNYKFHHLIFIFDLKDPKKKATPLF